MFDFLPKDKLANAELLAIKKKVWDLVNSPSITRPAPSVLYHYTDASGLKGIIESGTLRATHIAFMNDASEYLHAVELLAQAIRAAKIGTKRDKLKLLEQLEPAVSGVRPEQVTPYFVTCFSEQANSLNQWRAYGRGEGGFSQASNCLALVWPRPFY